MSDNYIESEGERGGDKIERLGWPIFGKEKFPNYELLWQRYVVPRTNRNTDIHFSSSTTLEEREIASIHYAIFHNFYTIYNWLASTVGTVEKEDQLFEHAFMKLSNTCDLVEELLLKLLILTGELNENHALIQQALKDHSIDKKIEALKKLTAKSILKDLQRSGTSSIRIINRINLLSKKFKLKNYKSLSAGIRSYRNIIVHSWQSFKIDNKVPNISYVQKYQDWLAVTDVVKSKDEKSKIKMVDEEFVPMRVLIKEQTDQLVVLVNELWNEVIPLLPEPPIKVVSSAKTGGSHSTSMIGDSIRTTTSGTMSGSSSQIKP